MAALFIVSINSAISIIRFDYLFAGRPMRRTSHSAPAKHPFRKEPEKSHGNEQPENSIMGFVNLSSISANPFTADSKANFQDEFTSLYSELPQRERVPNR